MSQYNGDHQSSEPAAEALTALALNQLHGEDLAAAESQLAAAGDVCQREVREIQSLTASLSAARNAQPLPQPSAGLRKALEDRLGQVELPSRSKRFERVMLGLTIGAIAAVLCAFLLPRVQTAREAARRMKNGNTLQQIAAAQPAQRQSLHGHRQQSDMYAEQHGDPQTVQLPDFAFPSPPSPTRNDLSASVGNYSASGVSGRGYLAGPSLAQGEQGPPANYGRYPAVGGVAIDESGVLAEPNPEALAIRDEQQRLVTELTELEARVKRAEWERHIKSRTEGPGTEQYDRIIENAFLSPRQQPLSTFSIDVDTASYSNVRRFLTSGRLPPANAVRIEELVNYFKYDYPQPAGREPFSVNMEVAECPWQSGHLLLRVGLKGKEVAKAERPASNLVFLLDVSGSMSDENKLPLLKTAMQLLAGELGENDRVSIVTYAGEAGLRLPPTRGHERARIDAAIDSLSAGGSTNGSAGINLAYEQAAAYFVKEGTNRVILCTDGDLNVGITSDDALVELIKQRAAGGTFLTVLGFGEGNLKDAKLEKLADNGNGLFAYIDSVREARKVLVEQLTGSTITIAKDVKIQIEFNPQEIAAYRLLGYENRVLAAEDFNNDQKDAGEIGAGHTVTALYELVPAGAAVEAAAKPGVEPLKYQESGVRSQESGAVGNALRGVPLTAAAKSGELLTLKLRYKEPDGVESRMVEFPLKDRDGSFHAASRDLQFAASVASFGMILRGSQHRGNSNLPAVLEIASTSLGDDPGGYRAEFVDLVRKAQALGGR